MYDLLAALKEERARRWRAPLLLLVADNGVVLHILYAAVLASGVVAEEVIPEEPGLGGGGGVGLVLDHGEADMGTPSPSHQIWLWYPLV